MKSNRKKRFYPNRQPRKQPAHYNIIDTPDFLIEYDNHHGGNHIHAVISEKGSDFKEDLLKMHLKKDHQGKKN